MNDQLIDAIFEHGSFRPLEPLQFNVQDGDRVRLRVEGQGASTSVEQGCQVYDGLSAAEIEEIERIALDRSNFFRARGTE